MSSSLLTSLPISFSLAHGRLTDTKPVDFQCAENTCRYSPSTFSASVFIRCLFLCFYRRRSSDRWEWYSRCPFVFLSEKNTRFITFAMEIGVVFSSRHRRRRLVPFFLPLDHLTDESTAFFCSFSCVGTRINPAGPYQSLARFPCPDKSERTNREKKRQSSRGLSADLKLTTEES